MRLRLDLRLILNVRKGTVTVSLTKPDCMIAVFALGKKNLAVLTTLFKTLSLLTSSEPNFNGSD